MKPLPMCLALLVACVGVGLSGCGDPPSEGDDEVGTETGDGDGDGDPGDGDGDPGDGDGDGDPGDGDGEPGDGDGDGEPAECGNGTVEGDEACDDGNDVEDDDCTNACALPACGDGIVQAGHDETCDDGNAVGGDGCTASCVLPGAMIGEAIIDVGEATSDIGYEVVIDSGDNVAVLLESDGAYRLAEYDPELAASWNFAALSSANPTLAIGPDDTLVVGGRIGNQGSTRKYDSDGNQLWTRNVPSANSWIYSVAVAGDGSVLAAGFAPGGGNDDALVIRYTADGDSEWTLNSDDSDAYAPITSGQDGQLWVMRETPRQLENYAADMSAGWTSEELADTNYPELAVDSEGNVYVLAAPSDASMFRLHKFDSAGALVWTAEHDDPDVFDTASGLTLLPGGAILVAGFTNGSQTSGDGLLTWFDADGNQIHELVLDSPADEDLDVFNDVAVAPGGDHAVAVGVHIETGGTHDVWLYKFEI